MAKTLEDPVTIHFKEDSIPSLRRGVLTDESKADIKALMLELVQEAHQDTTKGNFMPLISSYRAVDDMKKYLNQKVDAL